MAEIVRISTTQSEQRFSLTNPSEPQRKTTNTIIARSIQAAAIDVSALRDLVAALDAAGVSSRAMVQHHTNNGHLTQLVVRQETEVYEPETAERDDGDSGSSPSAVDRG